MNPKLKFTLKYLVILVLILFLTTPVFEEILSMITLILLKLVFFKAIILNSTIYFNHYSFEVTSACLATFAYILTLIFTLTIPNKNRFEYFGIGVLLIFIFNLLRIIILILGTIIFGEGYFHLVHFLFYSIFSGFGVILIILLIYKKYNIKEIPFYSDVKHILSKD
jgi:exosortase/archaeosortase family protein